MHPGQHFPGLGGLLVGVVQLHAQLGRAALDFHRPGIGGRGRGGGGRQGNAGLVQAGREQGVRGRGCFRFGLEARRRSLGSLQIDL